LLTCTRTFTDIDGEHYDAGLTRVADDHPVLDRHRDMFAIEPTGTGRGLRSEIRAQFRGDPRTYTGSDLEFGDEQRDRELRSAADRVARGDYANTMPGVDNTIPGADPPTRHIRDIPRVGSTGGGAARDTDREAAAMRRVGEAMSQRAMVEGTASMGGDGVPRSNSTPRSSSRPTARSTRCASWRRCP
jgi:hypothetical protein